MWNLSLKSGLGNGPDTNGIYLSTYDLKVDVKRMNWLDASSARGTKSTSGIYDKPLRPGMWVR